MLHQRPQPIDCLLYALSAAPANSAAARFGVPQHRAGLGVPKSEFAAGIGAGKKADALPLGDAHRKADDLLLGMLPC
jgi:hypothetical protein